MIEDMSVDARCTSASAASTASAASGGSRGGHVASVDGSAKV